MTECTPTCDEYTIEVPTPKDAENRRVPLDTKVMYNSDGVEYKVSGFIFDTSKFVSSWDVKCFTSPSDLMYVYQLDSMYLEKPDSLKQLAKDLNSVQAKHDEHYGDDEYSGNYYEGTPCVYAKRKKDSCTSCQFFYGADTCFEKMMGDIVHRVNRLAGDSE